MKSKLTWFATAAAVMAGMTPSAHAQEASSGAAAQASSDEIIVTARKVAESVQEIPMSITAFSGEQLEARGLDDLTDIAHVTPGFSFENYNGGFPTPVIRGQSQTRLTNPVQNVATFFNGVYLQRGYMVDSSLLQIDRVEVLRGPQSAALGRNAFAGAVNFITRTPDDEFKASASASVGENEYEKYVVNISGPIVEGKLRGIAGYNFTSFDGGWANNHALANAPGARTSGNLGGYENKSYLVGLNFEPIKELRFDLTYSSSERDTEAQASYAFGAGHLEALNGNNCSPGAGPLSTQNMLFCGTLTVNPTLAPGETRKPGFVIDPRSGVSITSDILTFAANWDASEVFSVSYLYGHAEGTFEGAGASNRDAEVGYTGLGSVVGVSRFRNLADNTGNGKLESDSHELRFNYDGGGATKAYIGLYDSSSDDLSKGISGFWPAQTSGALLPIILDPTFAGSIDSNTETEVKSIFAFAETGVGAWTFSLEARHTDEEQTIHDRPVPGNLFATPAANSTLRFDYFTPRGTISYDLTDDSRIYVSAGRGVKSGGFNAGGSNPATFVDPSQAKFDIEENTTYELGSRNEFFDNRLILNGTAYYIDTTGLQVTGQRIIAGGGGSATQTVITNSGDATNYGAEIDARLKATDNLSVYGGISYTNAEYGDGTIDRNIVALGLCATNTVCRSDGNIGGNRLERSPDWTGNIGFDFDQALSDATSLYVRGNTSYVGVQYVNNVNTAKIGSRFVTDMSLGVEHKGFDVRLSADNVFDEKYVASSFNTQFGTSPFFFVRNYAPNMGDRRRVALTLSYAY